MVKDDDKGIADAADTPPSEPGQWRTIRVGADRGNRLWKVFGIVVLAVENKVAIATAGVALVMFNREGLWAMVKALIGGVP